MSSETKVNVLLVDDHPENLVALEAIIHPLGQNLVSAVSGEHALRCLLDQDFAVILLDVQMVGMDGFETAALIRQRERSRYTPIIFLTAFSDNEALISKGYALGAVDYLLKPIDPMILTSKVSVFVDLYKKNIEVRRQAEQLVAKNLEILHAEAARQQAETANRMKDEFLAIVSHELRTPLNSILGWSQLLLNRKLDEAKTTQALQIIARNAKSQAQLVEDILDVSGLMQGKIRLDLQAVDAIAVIDSVVTSVQPLLAGKSLQLETQLHPSAQMIQADPERLRQIIWNLVTNAIKFTPVGGQITVTLSVERSQPSTHPKFAQLQVIDTGIGIAADLLPHIFDYFRQADSSSTRAQGGLGLGLAIVSQLVALHHGRIVAESAGAGQGSTFTVYLPLALTQQENWETTATGMKTETNGQTILDWVQVLLVEDHDDNRALIQFVLEQTGAKVTAVACAEAALSVLEQTTPDILISDIAMPETDGYQLIRQIRAQEQHSEKTGYSKRVHLPAIALTAYAKSEDAAQALASGFQAHLAKPVDATVLINTIMQLLNDRQNLNSGLVAQANNPNSVNLLSQNSLENSGDRF
jgi:signal transduction histidine kinase